jgi:hypothetical protein
MMAKANSPTDRARLSAFNAAWERAADRAEVDSIGSHEYRRAQRTFIREGLPEGDLDGWIDWFSQDSSVPPARAKMTREILTGDTPEALAYAALALAVEMFDQLAKDRAVLKRLPMRRARSWWQELGPRLDELEERAE